VIAARPARRSDSTDNRLTIESPGSFMPNVTPQNIYTVHNPRNRALMEAMFILGFVQCAREGCRRMRETMQEQSLPEPEFCETDDVGYAEVRVVLRNDIRHRMVWLDTDATAVVGEAVSKTLDSRQIRAINFAAEYGSINASEAMRLLTCNWHTAKKILADLADREIFRHIKKEGHDTKANFVLNVQPEATEPKRVMRKRAKPDGGTQPPK
jgi:ATP-dependent DNA helicase RecG